MRRRWAAAVLLPVVLAAVVGLEASAHHRGGHVRGPKPKAGPPTVLAAPFTDVVAFATKTGFRSVVAWSASEPVSGVVHYGTDPEALDLTAIAPGPPDTAQLAILDDLETGQTYHFVVEDLLSGATTDPGTFEAANAYTAYGPNTEDTDPSAKDDVYTIDLLVQLDSQSLPEDVSALQTLEDIAAGINVFAERVYDAVDGYARIGNVLITDTLIDHAGTVPGVVPLNAPGMCETPTNKADFLITTVVPFDSHTFGYAIDDPCMPFFVGRAGQLVAPWENDLHFGYVATHETMHYAFGAPDLYPGSPGGLATGADCRNLAWDGSLMHNTGGWNGQQWELTEVDRSQALTPCDMGSSEFTWNRIRSRYTNVPVPTAPEDMFNSAPRGNPDGGALDIRILDREVGASTLTSFTPDDGDDAGCGTPGASTSFSDPQGDATWFVVDTGVAALNDPALDVLGGAVSFVDDGDGQAGAGDVIRFQIEADDLRELPPSGSHGEHFDFAFTAGGDYLLVAGWDRTGPGATFELQQLAPTRTVVADTSNGIVGDWNLDTDVITIDVPAVIDVDGSRVFGVEGGSTLAAFGVTSRRQAVVVVPDADHATGGCPVAVPGTPVPPPPPVPDGTLSVSSPVYAWSGEPTTNVHSDPFGLGEVFGCEALSGPGCDEELIDVTVPAGGATLEVSVETQIPVNDYDVRLLGPDGQEIGSAGSPGTIPGFEVVSVPVTESGIYTVVVVAFTTVESTYDATATLGPPPAPSDFDGEISQGGSYSWSGDPSLDANPAFTCAEPVDIFCDNELVKVNVPAGGATLVVDINADVEGDDFDVCVYSPSGVQQCFSQTRDETGDEHVEIPVTASGVYRIGVQAFLAPFGTYSGTAALL